MSVSMSGVRRCRRPSRGSLTDRQASSYGGGKSRCQCRRTGQIVGCHSLIDEFTCVSPSSREQFSFVVARRPSSPLVARLPSYTTARRWSQLQDLVVTTIRCMSFFLLWFMTRGPRFMRPIWRQCAFLPLRRATLSWPSRVMFRC